VHVELARRAAVEKASSGAAADANIAQEGHVAAGLDEHQRVLVVRRGGERLRVDGARLVDSEVAAGKAAIGGAGQILPAHVAEERPHVVLLHKLMPWMGEVANCALLLGHPLRVISRGTSSVTAGVCIMFIVLKDAKDAETDMVAQYLISQLIATFGCQLDRPLTMSPNCTI
jgi:hypothetical protein